MTFYEKVQAMCQRKGIAVTALSTAIPGFTISRSAVSMWKKGSKPSPATVKAIADYFGVPVEYFTGGEMLPPAEQAAGASEQERALLEIYRRLPVLRQAQLLVYAAQLEKGDI